MHDDEEMKAGSLVPEAHDGPHRGVELPGGDALAGHEEGVRHHVGVGSVQLAEHLPGVGITGWPVILLSKKDTSLRLSQHKAVINE